MEKQLKILGKMLKNPLSELNQYTFLTGLVYCTLEQYGYNTKTIYVLVFSCFLMYTFASFWKLFQLNGKDFGKKIKYSKKDKNVGKFFTIISLLFALYFKLVVKIDFELPLVVATSIAIVFSILLIEKRNQISN